MQEYLKSAAIIGMVLVLASGVFVGKGFLDVYGRSVSNASQHLFAVSGDGKSVAVPDVAQFSFSVVTEGAKDMAVIMKENTDKVNRTIKYLKDNGVGDKDVSTEQYSLEPRYQYPDCSKVTVCPPPSIAGYTIRQSATVKVRDFSKVGALLSGVVQNGANTVSQFNMVVDKPEKYQADARLDAINKAKEKAEAIAGASGIRLGRLVAVEEGGVSSPTPPRPYAIGGAYDMMKSEAAMPAPSIEPGSQEITASVTLRYEIE